MPAELIVVSGPLTGNRYPVGASESEIGRAPQSTICIPEAEAAWRHCVVRADNGRMRVIDLHTAGGTYVNGMRVTSQCLEDGDQIAIGETVLVFRQAELASVQPAEITRVTLLRACTLMFLFQGMGSDSPGPHSELLEEHVLGLLGELSPCEAAAVLIANGAEEIRTLSQQRNTYQPEMEHNSTPVKLTYGLERLVRRVLAEGPVIDQNVRSVGVPVYAGGSLRGVLVARFSESGAHFLDDQLQIMSAVTTLAAMALENVREVQALKTENAVLQERLTSDDFGIVGKSAAMRKLLEMVRRVAAQDTTILVLGESGTGKELIARALHLGSPRREKPFVGINCAALTETLLESELFGHERGAFTGAVSQKKGKLEVAEGGTVFLDEIGELAPSLQAKLLRVLQEREFERVGGTKTLPLNIRLVAATNRDLLAQVKNGAFREDLYHRLNVVSLRMPPLRERPEDVSLLAEHFLRRSARRMGRAMAGITPEAELTLRQYSWPGNVRELENAMERAVLLSEAEWVTPGDLPDVISINVHRVSDPETTYESAVGDAKRQAVLRAWQQAGGDYKEAAALLGIHPNSLLRLIRKHGLRYVLGHNAGTQLG
jgi:Nif-specific regulatory protein